TPGHRVAAPRGAHGAGAVGRTSRLCVDGCNAAAWRWDGPRAGESPRRLSRVLRDPRAPACGLDRNGARQVQFLVVEEGGRAAAYVALRVVGATWFLEACGDFAP